MARANTTRPKRASAPKAKPKKSTKLLQWLPSRARTTKNAVRYESPDVLWDTNGAGFGGGRYGQPKLITLELTDDGLVTYLPKGAFPEDLIPEKIKITIELP